MSMATEQIIDRKTCNSIILMLVIRLTITLWVHLLRTNTVNGRFFQKLSVFGNAMIACGNGDKRTKIMFVHTSSAVKCGHGSPSVMEEHEE